VHYDVALILPTNLSLIEGDAFTSVGKFSFPKNTPDYAGEKNLWYRGMTAEFQSFQNTKQPPKKYSPLVRTQLWFDEKLQDIFPPEGYQILSGMLLGQRSMMTEVLKNQLKASGLMHLMVVSGGNIMMLIVFLSLFIRSMPVMLRIVIIAGTVFAFTLLVGGDMPVWRAALMGTIGYSAGLW
jgi:competence protein ComEC